MQMETWRHIWRAGIVPNVKTAGLVALKEALETDDAMLMQGGTTSPPPLMCVQDWKCCAACILGYIGWKGGELAEVECQPTNEVGVTVGDVEAYFADLCYRCDCALGEPAGCRWFLNWFDDTPRDEMRRELLAEVNLALAARTPKEVLEDIFKVPGHQVGAA